MAQGDVNVSFTGNLVDDPELRYTQTGKGVASFRVACTPRYLDRNTNEWKDKDSTFLSCTVWEPMAENVAESLTRGMRVTVIGRLTQRSYEAKDGSGKRTVFDVQVDEVGPSLRRASVKVNKSERGGTSTGRQSGDDPWQADSAGDDTQFTDEPPF